MKLKLQLPIVLGGLIALSSMAQADTKSSEPPDKEKISYALGMRLGLQRKSSDADTDVNSFVQGLKDVLEAKPTQIKESEIPSLLNEARVNGVTAGGEKGKEKVSYAMGMRLGGQLKRSGTDVDGNVIAQAIKDGVEGKPTQIQESEIPTILMRAQNSGSSQKDEKQQTEGMACLSKNAIERVITV